MPKSKEAFDAMRENTRRKIEVAALSLFAKRGLSVKVGDIAKEAGVSQGLMYSHYPSKDALIVELVRQAIMASSKNFMDFSSVEDGVPEKIKKTSDMMCYMFSSLPIGVHYFMFMTQVGMSGFQVPEEARYSEELPDPMEGLAAILAQGQAEGSVVEGDPLQLSITYWAVIQGMCCYAVTGIPAKPEPSTLNRIVLKEEYL